MAISPNTDFSAGQILTATQQNQFPRGIMQIARSSSSATIGTGGATVFTLSSFTAVANRYYKITYFEPYLETSVANNEIALYIRLTSASGTIIARGETKMVGVGDEAQCQAVFVGTLSAGATTIVCTAITIAGNCQFYGSTDYYRFCVVEDLGPA